MLRENTRILLPTGKQPDKVGRLVVGRTSRAYLAWKMRSWGNYESPDLRSAGATTIPDGVSPSQSPTFASVSARLGDRDERLSLHTISIEMESLSLSLSLRRQCPRKLAESARVLRLCRDRGKYDPIPQAELSLSLSLLSTACPPSREGNSFSRCREFPRPPRTLLIRISLGQGKRERARRHVRNSVGKR